jgi:hypothetical protein
LLRCCWATRRKRRRLARCRPMRRRVWLHNKNRSYAVALFGNPMESFLPAAAWYVPIVVCGVSALRAETPHTTKIKGTALSKAQYTNRVSPKENERQTATLRVLHRESFVFRSRAAQFSPRKR